MMKYFNVTKLLLGSILLLVLSACNKEPANIGVASEDYDLSAAIDSLPQKEVTTSSEKEVSDDIKPSESFACFGVNDQVITDFRAGVFVPGSLPLAELEDSSLTSQVEVAKNGDVFDVLFNYYKDGNKLVAQYECPKAIKGTSFLDHVNEDKYNKKCVIEGKAGQYVTSDGCKPRFYCQGPDVKLHIFENFLGKDTATNKIIKTFEIKNSNPCQKARELYKAAGEGNIGQIKKLISETDLNIATSLEPKGPAWEPGLVLALDRPLLNAINHNKNDAVKLLLDTGADPNLQNIEILVGSYWEGDDILDALGWATKQNNQEIIDWVSPKIANKNYSLLVAACYGNHQLVKEILKGDTSFINMVSVLDDKASTPLSCALDPEEYTPEHREVVKTLIAYGADVNKYDPYGENYDLPLRLAVLRNDLEIVKLLLDNGADIHLAKGEYIGSHAWSVLKIAQEAGNEEMVALLKSAGAKEQEWDEDE